MKGQVLLLYKKPCNKVFSNKFDCHKTSFMKKILMATLLLNLSYTLHAQTIATKNAKQKIGFGVQASVLSAWADVSNDWANGVIPHYTSNAKFGVRIGFVTQIPLFKQIAFTPSLNYVNKGTKVITEVTGIGDGNSWSNVTIATSHIEMPLNFTYNTGISKGFIAGLGLVISYGLGGTAIGTVTTYGFTGAYTTTINSSVKFDGNTHPTDGSTHFSAIEFGGNIMFGYKFSPNYSLSILYNQSFTNAFPKQSNYNSNYKTNYWGVNFGYHFF